jgi:hypothetical protein
VPKNFSAQLPPRSLQFQHPAKSGRVALIVKPLPAPPHREAIKLPRFEQLLVVEFRGAPLRHLVESDMKRKSLYISHLRSFLIWSRPA